MTKPVDHIADLTPVELAYAAGLIDGEGTLDARPHRSAGPLALTVGIRVGMTNRDGVEWLLAHCGGHVSKHRIANGNWPWLYGWRAGRPLGVALLERLSPYLVIKREEAALWLAIAAQVGHRANHLTPAEHDQRLCLVNDFRARRRLRDVADSPVPEAAPYAPVTLAYVAGLFDGEGWVTATARRRSRSAVAVDVRLGLSSSYRPVIDWLEQLYGGQRSSAPVGSGVGAGGRGARKREQYAWQLGCRAGEDLLHHLIPYLTVKREQAELWLAVAELVGKKGQRVAPEKHERRLALIRQLQETRRAS